MKVLRLLLPGVLLCLLGANAFANEIVLGPFYPSTPFGCSASPCTGQYTTNWGIDDSNNFTFLTDGSVIINVPKFSDTSEILTSVTFKLGGTVYSTYSITSTDPTSQNYTFSNSAELDLLEPGFDLNVGCPGNDPKCLAIATPSNSTTQFLNQGDTMSGTLTVSSEITGNAFTSASDLAAFTGSGFIALPVSATGLSSITGGTFNRVVTTQASAHAYVIYDFVPEPGWTGAGGLLVLAALELRRRRRK